MADETVDRTLKFVSEEAVDVTRLKIVPAGSVAFVVRSNILRRKLPVARVATPVTLNQDMRAVAPHDHVHPEYLFQVCRASAAKILAAAGRTDGSMAAIQSQQLMRFKIPLPSMDEQQRIADALRGFDALVNDLTSGLPAEIAARRQQYEYYRDKLLTFDEAV